MKIFDSVKKEKVIFEPIVAGEARIYVCGPTVYDDAHLGHARSAIAFDLLRRTLESTGLRVTFVKNFTDIDDKIIKKSAESGEPIELITARYIDSYLRDMELLGVLRPTLEPKATESLEAMWQFIAKLLDRGVAYQSDEGDIYLDVQKDPQYGMLSGRGEEDGATQSRIAENIQKKDSRDFALWKAYKGEDDVGYESPFGRGRPGWHIECSAMIDATIAHQGEYAIDIHAGGADLLFPHHENEASQTRCAKGQEIAKYWMHNGFVTIGGEKMSKSLGNSFFVKDALKVYDGEIVRFYLMGTHYRAPLHFSEEDLLASKKRLDRLYRLKKRVAGTTGEGILQEDFAHKLLEAMADDLNISVALSVIDEMLGAINEALDNNPKDKAMLLVAKGNLGYIQRLLGIGNSDATAYFQLGISKEQQRIIEEKIAQRNEAKKAKDFVRADVIRNELAEEGITLSDTPNGTIWERL